MVGLVKVDGKDGMGVLNVGLGAAIQNQRMADGAKGVEAATSEIRTIAGVTGGTKGFIEFIRIVREQGICGFGEDLLELKRG